MTGGGDCDGDEGKDEFEKLHFSCFLSFASYVMIMIVVMPLVELVC